jgi:YbbR domain-containing protein
MTVRGKLRKIFDISDGSRRTRIVLQILSIVFAASLWLFVTWDRTAPSSSNISVISVPLKYPDLQDGYSIANAVTVVDVTIEGRIERLALMDKSEITASVSVQDLRPGKYRLPVQLEIPDGVRLSGYSPHIVDVELFRIIERTLRPSLSVVGSTPENLSLGNVSITPAEVMARGPESLIFSIRRAEVRESVEKLTAGINDDLSVVLVGDGGDAEGILVEPAKVRVVAKLEEAVDQKRVPVRVTVEGTPAEGFDIGIVSVSPDMVTLRGRRSSLASVNEIALNAIDVTGHSEVMNIDVPLDSPASDITAVSADKVNVRVEFDSAMETVTFQAVPVSVDGRGVYLEWALDPASVSVTLERTVSSTEPFDISNPPLEPYVDVTNVVARRLMLPVLVRGLSGDMRVLRIEPERVTVNALIR